MDKTLAGKSVGLSAAACPYPCIKVRFLLLARPNKLFFPLLFAIIFVEKV
jgi:hypothetical protein